MADLDSLSLGAAFKRAGSERTDPAEALRLLLHCERLIAAAALFSSNEDQDDLETGVMRYLLVPFLKAERIQACGNAITAPAERLQRLEAAGTAYSEFLQRCRQYGFLGGACSDTYAAEEQGLPAADPGLSRTQRIERFKRGKALEGLLQQLNGRKQRADDEEVERAGAAGGWDEEDERLLWQLQLEAAAIKALDARPMLQREAELLQHAARQQQQQQQQPAQGAQGSSSHAPSALPGPGHGRPDGATPQQLQQQMLNKLAGIAGQLSLTGDRQALRQQVFRPSHILPTMTVEQQGAIELREAQQRQAQADEAAAAAAARRAGRRSDEEDEEELAAARAWDDFKDDNPRGWGNSKLRPCA